MRHVNIMYPLDVKCWEEHSNTFVVFLPKIHYLSLLTRKHETNPNQRIFYKITGQYAWKVSKSWKKKKERLRQYPWLEETKEPWQLKAMCDHCAMAMPDVNTWGWRQRRNGTLCCFATFFWVWKFFKMKSKKKKKINVSAFLPHSGTLEIIESIFKEVFLPPSYFQYRGNRPYYI